MSLSAWEHEQLKIPPLGDEFFKPGSLPEMKVSVLCWLDQGLEKPSASDCLSTHCYDYWEFKPINTRVS